MTIPTISTLPTAPARTDPPATFVTRADSFLAALVTMQSELNTTIGAMNTDIGGIAANVTAAQAAQTAAETAETNAEAAQAAAEAASNATLWVSGTSYSAGDVVYSPVDYKSYRANTATSGTTDPSASADWTKLTYALPSQSGNAGFYLTTDGSNESWAAVSTGGVELTASGSVSAGDGIFINSDGTATAITGQIGVIGAESLDASSNTIEQTASVYCSDSDIFVSVYREAGEVYIIGMQVDPTTLAITLGTRQLVGTGVYPTVNYLSDTGNVLVTYQNGTEIRVRAASISGTVFSFGTQVSLARTNGATHLSYPGYNPSTQEAFHSYRDYNTSDVRILDMSISGTAVTMGTDQLMISGASMSNNTTAIAYNSTNDVFALCYHNSSNYPVVVGFTSSSGTVTAGTPVVVQSLATTGSGPCITYDDTNDVFANVCDGGSSKRITVIYYSGTAMTISTQSSSKSYDDASRFIHWDSTRNKMITGDRKYASFGDFIPNTGGNSYYSFPGTGDITFNNNGASEESFAINPNGAIVNVAENGAVYFVASAATETSTNAPQKIYFAGLANTSAADGETFTLLSTGSVVDAYTGLTPGAYYRLRIDGSVGESTLGGSAFNNYTPLLGVAVSTTAILMKYFD